MSDSSGQIDLRMDRPHSARMYDYYLGGYTNFPADREAAGQAMIAFPSLLVAARANRRFMHRSTRYLAARGHQQFLDIGTGIPTSPNLHEIAQAITPAARIVYADNDPIVLAHAAALLHSTPQGLTAYTQADVTDPAALLEAPEIHATLDLDEPVALSLNALLHFVPDHLGAHAIVDRLKDRLAPGSALTMTHLTADFDPEPVHRLVAAYRAAGTSGQARTREEFTAFFTGWTLLEDGVTPTPQWNPDRDNDRDNDPGNVTDAEAACYAAVAVKP
jgi:hypothetical protein